MKTCKLPTTQSWGTRSSAPQGAVLRYHGLPGISITLVSCIFYVGTWEILYFKFMPDFMDNYGAATIEKLKASGASPAAVEVRVQQLQKLEEQYKNPFINSLMTFIEPFPVGLAITLLSAAILGKKAQSQSAQSPLLAS